MSYETKEYKGYTIRIEIDESPGNPRTGWDNLGTMVAFHRNYYNLGDKDHGYNKEELLELVARKDVFALPLFLYDHSGITMNTTGFSCQWDSGQVGFIYMTRKQALAELADRLSNGNLKCWQYITAKRKKRIFDYLRTEVQTYDDYLTGNVFGYIVENSDGEEIDSCWGFYGYDHEKSGLMEYAKNAIDCQPEVKEPQLKLEF